MEQIVLSASRKFGDIENAVISGAPDMDRIAEVGGSHPTDFGRVNVEFTGSAANVIITDVSNVTVSANKKLKSRRLSNIRSINTGWYAPNDKIRKGGRHGFSLAYTQNYPETRTDFDTCIGIGGLGYAGKTYYTGPSPEEQAQGAKLENKIANVHYRRCIWIGDERDVLIGGERHGSRDCTYDECIIDCPVFAFGYDASDERLALRGSVVFGKVLTTSIVVGMELENLIIIQPNPNEAALEVASGKFVTNLTFKNITIYTDGKNPIRGMYVPKGGSVLKPETFMSETSPGITLKPLREAPPIVRVHEIEGLGYRAANVFVYNPSGAPTVPLPAGWEGATIQDVRRYREDLTLYRGEAFIMSAAPTQPLNFDDATYGSKIPKDRFPYSGVFHIAVLPNADPEEDPVKIAELERQLAEMTADLDEERRLKVEAQADAARLTSDLNAANKTIAEQEETLREYYPDVLAMNAVEKALEVRQGRKVVDDGR